jgi:CspA family cold shock protein
VERGTIKWFDNQKGYGFIGRADEADVFVHYSAVQAEGYKSLNEGDVVEFDIVQGDKGPQAANVYVRERAKSTASPKHKDVRERADSDEE